NRLLLDFDGIYCNSEVWINGQFLGSHSNGFIGFQHDVTSYAKWGGNNLITVRVDNSQQPNCRWYSGSGIYRHVWLTIAGNLRVGPWGTRITTQNIDASTSQVHIATTIVNDG